MSNPAARIGTLVVSLALFANLSVGDVRADEPESAHEYVQFPERPEVSFRKTSGSIVRGRLIGFTYTEVSYLLPINGRELTVKWSTIREMRTVDGQITYSPGKDEYDSLLDACEKVGAQFFSTDKTVDALASMGAETAVPGIEFSAGRGKRLRRPKPMIAIADFDAPPLSALEPENAPPLATAVAAIEPTAMPKVPVASYPYSCYQCREVFELERPLRNGDRCPKCGAEFHVADSPNAAGVGNGVVTQAPSGWLNGPMKIAIFLALTAGAALIFVGRR